MKKIAQILHFQHIPASQAATPEVLNASVPTVLPISEGVITTSLHRAPTVLVHR